MKSAPTIFDLIRGKEAHQISPSEAYQAACEYRRLYIAGPHAQISTQEDANPTQDYAELAQFYLKIAVKNALRIGDKQFFEDHRDDVLLLQELSKMTEEQKSDNDSKLIPDSKNSTIQECIIQGRRSLKGDDISNALEQFNKAIELDEKCAEAYYGRSLCHFKLGKKEQDQFSLMHAGKDRLTATELEMQARKNRLKAIELDPTRALIYSEPEPTLDIFHRSPCFSAVMQYRMLIEKNPLNFYAYYCRAEAYIKIKLEINDTAYVRQAINDYNKIIELNPNPENDLIYFIHLTYLKRGLAFQQLDDHSKAMQDFNKCIEFFSQHIELNEELSCACYGRAYSHTKQGNFLQAVRDANKAVEINPERLKRKGQTLGELSDSKKSILKEIKDISDLSIKQKLLCQALLPTTFLGYIFYSARNFSNPSISNKISTIHQIAQLLEVSLSLNGKLPLDDEVTGEIKKQGIAWQAALLKSFPRLHKEFVDCGLIPSQPAQPIIVEEEQYVWVYRNRIEIAYTQSDWQQWFINISKAFQLDGITCVNYNLFYRRGNVIDQIMEISDLSIKQSFLCQMFLRDTFLTKESMVYFYHYGTFPDFHNAAEKLQKIMAETNEFLIDAATKKLIVEQGAELRSALQKSFPTLYELFDLHIWNPSCSQKEFKEEFVTPPGAPLCEASIPSQVVQVSHDVTIPAELPAPSVPVVLEPSTSFIEEKYACPPGGIGFQFKQEYENEFKVFNAEDDAISSMEQKPQEDAKIKEHQSQPTVSVTKLGITNSFSKNASVKNHKNDTEKKIEFLF